jgi:chemotaxis protein CheX
MKQKHIDVFIDALTRYFDHLDVSITGERGSLEIAAPYLLQSNHSMGLDYSGVISVTGDNNGYVFITAKSSLLKYILLSHGEIEFSHTLKEDLVGEVANTIAGNARRKLGAGFHISTPRVLTGALDPSGYTLSSRCYVLPFRWKSNRAELIVSI